MTRAPPKQAAATSWPVVLIVLCWHVVSLLGVLASAVAAVAVSNRVHENAVHGIAVTVADTPLMVDMVLLWQTAAGTYQ